MNNSAVLALKWTEFVASRPEFQRGDLLLRQFSSGQITRLCDCGCNSYDITVRRSSDLLPLTPPSEKGGCAFELEFNTDEWGKTVSFTLFVDKEGYLAGIDVDYCGNSFAMPEHPRLSEPPFHIRGALASEAQPLSQQDAAR
jgi:hypothetical protein